MRVLLLSAYAAHSHRHWETALRSMLPDWDWRVLSLPPRYFSWRVRGNALYWSLSQRQVLEEGYDLLLATSMVDLATLRGLVPALAQIPAVVYFHENQFAYPLYRQQHSQLEAQLTSIYTALAADRLLFNSCYNLDTFVDGCDALLRKMPDKVPPGVARLLLEKAQVLPVPVEEGQEESRWPGRSPGVEAGGAPRLLWVGRFEHDKNGDGLLRILRRLESSGLDYELAVCGQQFRESPTVFSEISEVFSHRLVQFGYLENVADFRGLLAGADLALSTALHEFQGLAVMEAVVRGCLPVVPDRLAYPETYPDWCRYDSSPDDPDREAEAATQRVLELVRLLSRGEVRAPDVTSVGVTTLTPRYKQVLEPCGALQDSQ